MITVRVYIECPVNACFLLQLVGSCVYIIYMRIVVLDLVSSQPTCTCCRPLKYEVQPPSALMYARSTRCYSQLAVS